MNEDEDEERFLHTGTAEGVFQRSHAAQCGTRQVQCLGSPVTQVHQVLPKLIRTGHLDIWSATM